MSTIAATIRANIAEINDRVAAACTQAGRDPGEVTVVAVTKYARPEWVRELVAQGVRHLGESRPQQLVERADWFGESVHWHLVGHLQRNKARKVLPVASLIHSVDSLRLLAALDRIADEQAITQRVLLEVNVSGEQAKHGFDPRELAECWNELLAFNRVRIEGLMTMAPRTENLEDSRPHFRQLRVLRDALRDRSPDSVALPELSMGMSGDFETGIAEGATLVRIGSRLFAGLSTS